MGYGNISSVLHLEQFIKNGTIRQIYDNGVKYNDFGSPTKQSLNVFNYY